MTLERCPFCGDDTQVPGRFLTKSGFQAVYNIAPVVEGHVIVAPLAHVTSLLDFHASQYRRFFVFARAVTERVLSRVSAEAFDWALQDGVVAGQTIGHIHLHILPRRSGDMDRPGAWFVSLFGREAASPDSEDRPQLSAQQLARAVAMMK